MEPGICFADETEIHANVLIQATCLRATHEGDRSGEIRNCDGFS
jgi:hypothetical protein